MPQENVEIIRVAFEAYQRGDEAGMLALVSPDILATQFPDQLDVRDFHGHDGVRQVMAEWIGAWEDWTIELLAAREIDGHVLAAAHQAGRGKISGVPVQSDVYFLFTIRDGAIVRWRMFRSEREALEAATAAD